MDNLNIDKFIYYFGLSVLITLASFGGLMAFLFFCSLSARGRKFYDKLFHITPTEEEKRKYY